MGRSGKEVEAALIELIKEKGGSLHVVDIFALARLRGTANESEVRYALTQLIFNKDVFMTSSTITLQSPNVIAVLRPSTEKDYYVDLDEEGDDDYTD